MHAVYIVLAVLLNMLVAETGHSHYYGSWYFQYVHNDLSVEEWKAECAARHSAFLKATRNDSALSMCY